MIFPEAELLLGTRKTYFRVQRAFCMQIKGSIFSPLFLFKLPLDFHLHFMPCPYLFFKKVSFTNKVLLSLPWHKVNFLVPKAGKEISWQYSTYRLVILMMQNMHVLIEIKIKVTEVKYGPLRSSYQPTPECQWTPAWLPLLFQIQICSHVCPYSSHFFSWFLFLLFCHPFFEV